MSDYVNSIKSLDVNSTDINRSSGVSTDIAAIDANEVTMINDDTPISTSAPGSTENFEQPEIEVPDYLATSKIRVRKYQLKKW